MRVQAKESVRKQKREGPFGKPFWETSKTPSKWPRAPNGENPSKSFVFVSVLVTFGGGVKNLKKEGIIVVIVVEPQK